MGDLTAPFRQRPAVDQLDQNRDVTRLDDVKDVLAQPIHYRAGHTEPRHAAPGHSGRAEIFIPEGADAPADHDAGAGRKDIGQRDPEIDRRSQEHERQRPHHQAERLSDIEIPQSSGFLSGVDQSER